MANPPKIALISEYFAADSSPEASADALAIINIGKFQMFHTLLLVSIF